MGRFLGDGGFARALNLGHPAVQRGDELAKQIERGGVVLHSVSILPRPAPAYFCAKGHNVFDRGRYTMSP